MKANESLMRLTNKEATLADLAGIEADVQEHVIAQLRASGKEVVRGLEDSLPVAQAEADKSSTDTFETIRSAPGSKPMVQTGYMRDNIFHKVLPVMLGEAITLKIGTSGKAFYGHILEFGSSVMAARPWFYSGVLNLIPSMRGQLERTLEAVIQKRNNLRKGYVRYGKIDAATSAEQAAGDLGKLADFKGL